MTGWLLQLYHPTAVGSSNRFTSCDMSQDMSKLPFPSTFHVNVFLKTLNPAFTFQMVRRTRMNMNLNTQKLPASCSSTCKKPSSPHLQQQTTLESRRQERFKRLIYHSSVINLWLISSNAEDADDQQAPVAVCAIPPPCFRKEFVVQLRCIIWTFTQIFPCSPCHRMIFVNTKIFFLNIIEPCKFKHSIIQEVKSAAQTRWRHCH